MPKLDRLRRPAWVASLLVISALLVAGVLFPYLLKRYIERNSKAWIDRHITIGSIVLNPFSGVYSVNGFVCLEPDDVTVFVSFDKLGVKGSVMDGLLNGHWQLHGAELRAPHVRVEQVADRFNFSDLLDLASSGEDEAPVEDPSEAAFTLRGITLTGGRIDYFSDLMHAPLQVVDLQVNCDLLTSADARMAFDLGFGLPDGTRLDGGFVVDTDSARYTVNARLRDLDLSTSLPYLQDLFTAGQLEGRLDVDLLVHQRYSDGGDLALSSRVELRDLLLKDDRDEHLLSLERMQARLDTLHGDLFQLGAVLVDGLDIRLALLSDGSDNWTRLLQFAPDSAGEASEARVLDASESNYLVLLAEYIGYLGSAFTGGRYTADSLAVTNGRLRFEDHTMPSSSVMDINEITLRAERFNESNPSAPVSASARFNEASRVTARAEFDPKDFRNVEILVQVDSLMLAQFDPYTRWYAAHPTADGVLSYTSTTSIRNGIIDSQNRVLIDRLSFGRPVDDHHHDIYLLPLRLASGLLKDAKGKVTLELPVKGDLGDPQFRVWPIVWQVLKNLVVKAVMAPARLIAGLFDGAEEKDLELVRFEELQRYLGGSQRRVLDQLTKALEAKPELKVDLVPVVDSLAETGELALFAARARYLFPGKVPLDQEDSTRVLGLQPQDSSFVSWMDAQLPGTAELPIVQRSVRFMGLQAVQGTWQELERTRREQVMQALLGKGLDPRRLRFRQGSSAEVAPYKGLPGYRFIYDVLD